MRFSNNFFRRICTSREPVRALEGGDRISASEETRKLSEPVLRRRWDTLVGDESIEATKGGSAHRADENVPHF